MIQRSSEIADVIRRFSKNFAEGKPLYNAYFITSDKILRDTIQISKIDALKVRPHGIGEASPNDYAIAVHPDTLLQLRAEFHRLLPGHTLRDKEIATMLVGGSI